MKKLKNLNPRILTLAIVLAVVVFAGNFASQRSLVNSGVEAIYTARAYAASQVDTTTILVPPTAVTLTLDYSVKDSAEFIVHLDRIVYNSSGSAVAAASTSDLDSLISTSNTGAGKLVAVTLSPVPEAFRVRTEFKADGNGTNTATYSLKVVKTFYSR